MRLRRRIRGLRWAAIALAAAAVAAPGAQAAALSGDGGVSAGQVAVGGGNGSSAQVAVGGGNGSSARVEQRDEGFGWSSALLAGAALAALGATGGALSRRPRRQTATLTI